MIITKKINPNVMRIPRFFWPFAIDRLAKIAIEKLKAKNRTQTNVSQLKEDGFSARVRILTILLMPRKSQNAPIKRYIRERKYSKVWGGFVRSELDDVEVVIFISI